MEAVLLEFDHVLEKATVKTKTEIGLTSWWILSIFFQRGVGFGGNKKELDGNARQSALQLQNKDDNFLKAAIVGLHQIIKNELFNTDTLQQDLERSAGLRWTFKCLLANDSLLDIGNRADLYNSMLALIKIIANEPFAAPYLAYTPHADESNIFDMLHSLEKQASAFLLMQSNVAAQKRKNTHSEIQTPAQKMAQTIIDSFSTLNKGLKDSKKLGILSQQSASSGKRKRSSEANCVVDHLKQCGYLSALRPLKFEAISLCDMIENGDTEHYFIGGRANKYIRRTTGHAGVIGDARKRLARVACEMSGLSSSLPVELGSSIFVRCDESRMDVLKALIVGPEGTPYANGLFEFDILLPPAYPSAPPKVQLVTTGGGSVRFNPNLYNCGKVCLSLLGTWAGPGWDPKESTLLQVLVSIQSLILVPDPFYNEPGFAMLMYTPMGMFASATYNSNIRIQTLRHAILSHLLKPSPVFKDVIELHFYHKRDEILKQLNSCFFADRKLIEETKNALQQLVTTFESKQNIKAPRQGEVIDLIGDDWDENVDEGEDTMNKKVKRGSDVNLNELVMSEGSDVSGSNAAVSMDVEVQVEDSVKQKAENSCIVS